MKEKQKSNIRYFVPPVPVKEGSVWGYLKKLRAWGIATRQKEERRFSCKHYFIKTIDNGEFCRECLDCGKQFI